MLEPKHPTAILRLAWKQVRLDTIRLAAGAAIEDIEELNRRDLLLHTAAGEETALSSSAAAAALRTCVHELREESGLQPVNRGPDRRVLSQDPRWSESYAVALERYRGAAGLALTRLLAAPSEHGTG